MLLREARGMLCSVLGSIDFFEWGRTPEGQEYWDSVCGHLRDITEDTADQAVAEDIDEDIQDHSILEQFRRLLLAAFIDYPEVSPPPGMTWPQLYERALLRHREQIGGEARGPRPERPIRGNSRLPLLQGMAE